MTVVLAQVRLLVTLEHSLPHPESLSSLARDLTCVWGEPAVRGASVIIFSLSEQFTRAVDVLRLPQNCAVFGLSPAFSGFPAGGCRGIHHCGIWPSMALGESRSGS